MHANKLKPSGIHGSGHLSQSEYAHHLSAMMMSAIDAATKASNSSTGLSAPKRECVPIIKARTKSCTQGREKHKPCVHA